MGKGKWARSYTVEELCGRLTWEDLDTSYLVRLIDMARSEDLFGLGLKNPPKVGGDVTTAFVAPRGKGAANLVARGSIRVCGVSLIPLILEVYGVDCKFDSACLDGDLLQSGERIGCVFGDVATLLGAERVILNFLQHLSGIATETAKYVDALAGSATRLLDTRKTTPGFRVLEKYAVACGGGWNHRIGLFDRIMLKDNHLASIESLSEDGAAGAPTLRRELPLEIEVDGLDQIEMALQYRPDVVLLDNFEPDELGMAVELLCDHTFTEASGGVTLAGIGRIGSIGLDFISTGALVHQSQWVDIGMDWEGSI